MIQGTGRPTRMSKTLEPIEEDTAMSPSPFRATATEEAASGMEVPMARSVKFMMTSLTPRTCPKVCVHQTRRKAKPAIQTSESRNVATKTLPPLCGFGSRKYTGTLTGKLKNHRILLTRLSSSGKSMMLPSSLSSSASAGSSFSCAADSSGLRSSSSATPLWPLLSETATTSVWVWALGVIPAFVLLPVIVEDSTELVRSMGVFSWSCLP
mmetsp:Transcript_21955/g.65979  ORF Transcript_21955/g.65979 Transcript_21955/m.65979 type:complete len:210 (+) Transcript_21955:458-1087(+)